MARVFGFIDSISADGPDPVKGRLLLLSDSPVNDNDDQTRRTDLVCEYSNSDPVTVDGVSRF